MTTPHRKPPAGWKKGQSGNPAGRTPGTGEVAKLRAAIAKQVPAIIEQLTTAALAGDVGAARLLLERTIAPFKATEQAAPLTLPDGTFTQQGRAVINAVAAGHVAMGDGAALLGSLCSLAKLAEADEIERRVSALEARATRSAEA
jgi:hypothetical protein